VTWDSTRRLPTQVVAPGLTTTYAYDTTSGGGSGGGGSGTNKRFWRVHITNANGAGFGGTYYANIAEIQMFETAGGPDLARTAPTIINSTVNSSYGPTLAVDGDFTTTTSLVNGSAGPPYTNMYWGADFGAGASKSIQAVSITAWASDPSATPSDFTVDSSPDGITWTTAWSVTGQSGWGAGETRLFVNPSYTYTHSFWGAHAYWRALMGAHASGNWSAAEQQYRATPGGADQASGATITASSALTGYAATMAHDGNASTFWVSSGGAAGQYIQYHFSSAVTLAEVLWTARNDGYYAEAPTAGTMQYSDDGTTWHEAFGLRNTAGWTTNGQSFTFTDPAYKP
jgi:hypothetical protein